MKTVGAVPPQVLSIEEYRSGRQRQLVTYIRASFQLPKLQKYLAALPGVQFIVVSAALRDEDRAEVERLCGRYGCIHSDIGIDLGKGAGLRAGLGLATKEYVGLLELDGFINAGSILTLFSRIEREPTLDGIVGDRWPSNRPPPARRLRTVSSKLFTRFANALFRLRVKDVQCPIKVFRRGKLAEIFDRLRLANSGFDTELLYHVRKAGARLAESPVEWTADEAEFPLKRTAVRALLALITIRLLEFPYPGLQFVSWLGRRYFIPAKRNYSILIFAWRDPRHPEAGGGEIYLHEQARYWAALGHKVTWVSQRFDRTRDEIVDGVQVHRVARFPWVFAAAGLWYLFRTHQDYDFIIDCMNGIPFFTPFISTKPKVCLVYHIHSHHFKAELPWPVSALAVAVETKLVPFVYRNTPFVTISDSTRDEMNALGMSRFPITLIHSGVSSALVPRARANIPTVLYLGRLKRYKRVRKLIDAFVRIQERVPAAQLVIAGGGDDASGLQEYVRERRIGGVLFAGRVSDEGKARLMGEAWVLGMPSSVEGWGIVVIEANSCATPAVAYNVNGLRDCIIDGVTGYLAKDDDEFANRLCEILLDEGKRRALSSAALEWSRGFSWSVTATETLNRIRSAMPWRAVFEPDEGAFWQLTRTK